MKIVCIGEALIDFKATGLLAFQGYVGGSPLNVAVAAARLGAEVGFASQVSTDLFGRALRAHMEENGVDTSFVVTSDDPSTLAFVDERGGDAHFEFFAGGAADTRYDPQPRPELPAEVAFVQFGSISLLREPVRTAVTDLVARHRGRCRVVFDPNVRPALIGEGHAERARYLESLKGWLELSHLVKVSAQDLDWLYPGAPVQDTAQAWLARGPEAVVVTRGGRGVSLFLAGQECVEVAVPEVEVVDTVGAGDTFTGALMAALLERGVSGSGRSGDSLGELGSETWREALTLAAAAAALNCTRAGAQPPDRLELAEFMEARRRA